MTTPKLHEYVVLKSLFAAIPAVGAYLTSPSGASVFQVSRIRNVGGDTTKPSVRLIGARLRRGDVPPGAVISPWPRQAKRPSRAAEGTPLHGPTWPPPAPIVTATEKQTLERKRLHAAKRRLLEPAHQAVEPVRLKSGTAQPSVWRDPTDSDVLRRTPREVHGYRRNTSIDHLAASGVIRRSHAWAATRFLGEYERSVGLGMSETDYTATKVSSSGGGLTPSEYQLEAIETVRDVQKLLGRLWDVVLAVVLQDSTIAAFAKLTGTNASNASGRLIAALDVLSQRFSPVEPHEEKTRHTIAGTRPGDAPS